MKGQRIAWLSAGVDHVPELDGWVDAELARRLTAMRYEKRHSESRLARWTAKSAVALHLGWEPSEQTLRSIVIRNAPDGAPEVDAGVETIALAMTDRSDWAVCMVADGNFRIGCDLEVVEPRSEAFVDDYFTPSEVAMVTTSNDRDLFANLIWSAKESALKVMRTGLRRDTRSVEVTLEPPRDDGWQPLVVVSTSGRRFPGWWLRLGDFVLTCAAEVDIAPPVALREPPALASAVPSHSWLERPMRS